MTLVCAIVFLVLAALAAIARSAFKDGSAGWHACDTLTFMLGGAGVGTLITILLEALF